MLKKVLASFGIGAAKVDAILDNDELSPGDEFSGEIKIYGGDVSQEISGLKVAIMTEAEVESGDSEYKTNFILEQWYMEDKYTINPDEVVTIPFGGVLPLETPISENGAIHNKTKVWLQTGLEIDLALDASDKDMLYVKPTRAMQNFITAMKKCGFHLLSADVEKGFLRASEFRSTIGVYQELEFRPNNSSLFGFNEVEVSFVLDNRFLFIMLEIDKAFRSDKLTTLAIPLNSATINNLTEQIKRVLS